MSKVNELASRIASEIQDLIESTAQERIKTLLSGVMDGVHTQKATRVASKPATGASSTKVKKHRNYHRKPCPVPNCKNMAAPRHNMVCKDHKDLSIREKDQFKAEAMAPGGVWYKEMRERANEKATKLQHKAA